MVHFNVNFQYFNSFADITLSFVKTLFEMGVPVSIEPSELSPMALQVMAEEEKFLLEYSMKQPPSELFQFKWSHYWQTARDIQLKGHLNFEFFAINYEFTRSDQPFDDWMRSTAENSHHKLAVSHYCKQVLLQAGCPESQISVLPLGANPLLFQTSPEKYRPNGSTSPSIKHFLHLTNSWDLYRFGTDLFLPLFCEEFRGNPDAVLIVKDGGSNNPAVVQMLEDLHEKYGDQKPKIYLIRRLLSKAELAKLYRLSDVVVAPFRGEGFAIKILDAFAAGLPVIMPLYGGPTEYANSDNCYPIDYDLVPLGTCYDTEYIKPQNSPRWAEPNRESLRQQLRRAMADENPALIGEKARETAQQFTWEIAAKKLLALIRKLC